jgi:hypothetical protein
MQTSMHACAYLSSSSLDISEKGILETNTVQKKGMQLLTSLPAYFMMDTSKKQNRSVCECACTHIWGVC